MKNLWGNLSELARYYFISMSSFLIFWFAFSLLHIEFLNTLFFVMAYVWHFTLLTPGLKEKMLTQKQRFSFINVVVRTNYYLQLFIRSNKIPFRSSVIRAISPFLFTFLLMVAGGNGNILFTLFGSFCFEITHYYLSKKKWNKTISDKPVDLETPPKIPNVESFHE